MKKSIHGDVFNIILDSLYVKRPRVYLLWARKIIH
jgi:hypothetical protein